MTTDMASLTTDTATAPCFNQHIQIPLAQTNQFGKLFLDYINQKEQVRPFYGHYPNLENFELQLKDKAEFSTTHREALVAALSEQYQGIEHAPINQIKSLSDKKTFTVTTGHQLNIFSGPLYFIYKIVSTINLAKKLKETYPSYQFVPVYWMATEDHDFEEIAHFRLFGKDYEWEKEAKGAVGRLDTTGIEEIIAQIGEMPEFFKQAYGKSQSLADATREYVNHLFGKEGLVIVDADHSKLKALFKEQTKADLLDNMSAEKALLTTQELESEGYKTQIYIRGINFFYLIDGLRERIEKHGSIYRVVNTDLKFTAEELEAEIENYPDRFSPNVVLRPVYQEVILPNLAYLGGPSEVAYWLQLKGVFDAFSIPFPMIMPRSFALIGNQTVTKRLNKLGIEAEELFKDQQVLKNELVDRNSDNEIKLNAELALLQEAFDKIAKKATEVDQSLKGFVAAEGQKAAKSVQNIEKRLKKAEERKQDTSISQLIRLKDQLFPNGSAQERVDNFLNFYLNDEQFIEKLLNQLDALDYRMNIFLE